jgi:hypothetical protein
MIGPLHSPHGSAGSTGTSWKTRHQINIEMPLKIRSTSVLAIICALVVVGCGGGSSTEDGSASRDISRTSTADTPIHQAHLRLIQTKMALDDGRLIVQIEELRGLQHRYEAEEAWGLLSQASTYSARDERTLEESDPGALRLACEAHPLWLYCKELLSH